MLFLTEIDVAPETVDIYPVGQLMHALAPAPLYVPREQMDQELAPDPE